MATVATLPSIQTGSSTAKADRRIPPFNRNGTGGIEIKLSYRRSIRTCRSIVF